jgi:hypothetical protein
MMRNLGLIIITVMLTLTGIELSQTATAAELNSQTVRSSSRIGSIALAKKCTIRRYGRPR